MDKKKRTGVYLSAQLVLDNPDYVEVLRDQIGLNLAIMGFSGTLPEEVLARSPFDAVPVSDECVAALYSRHLDGTPLQPEQEPSPRSMVGPAIHAGGDDDAYRKAIDLLRRAGLEVWMGFGSWTGSNMMFCPSKKPIDDWFEALYTYGASSHGVDGIDLTHARFPKCSLPRGLFACTCADCADEASAMGYDMEEMKSALRDGQDRLGSADSALLAAVGRSDVGPFDFLHWLGMGTGVIDWFHFRADLIGAKLKRFREVVKQTAGSEFLFGSDNYPASLSMFVGHDHTRWSEFSDFATPLVSHIGSFTVEAFVALAGALREMHPSLTEEEAFRLVYNFAGYGEMDLPETVAGFELDRHERLPHLVPLEELILRDLRKARLLLPAQMPSYPIIHGSGWPKSAIDAIVKGALEAGYDGFIWQGTDELVEYELKT